MFKLVIYVLNLVYINILLERLQTSLITWLKSLYVSNLSIYSDAWHFLCLYCLPHFASKNVILYFSCINHRFKKQKIGERDYLCYYYLCNINPLAFMYKPQFFLNCVSLGSIIFSSFASCQISTFDWGKMTTITIHFRYAQFPSSNACKEFLYLNQPPLAYFYPKTWPMLKKAFEHKTCFDLGINIKSLKHNTSTF